jgi:hypothetical protein
MRWIIATLLLLSAAAQAAPRYAIVSLLGDRLLLARSESGTGSHIDRNRREFVPVPEPLFDHTAVFAVEDAIKAADSSASTVLMQVRDPVVYEAQQNALNQKRGAEAILPALGGVLAQAKATHLVLVSKHRYDAHIALPDGYSGSGSLEGLGFYIDANTRINDWDNRLTATGFVAPFAYFRIALIDAASGKVLQERAVAASKAAWSQSEISPWDALSPDEKARKLQALIREEVRRVMPQILRR